MSGPLTPVSMRDRNAPFRAHVNRHDDHEDEQHAKLIERRNTRDARILARRGRQFLTADAAVSRVAPIVLSDQQRALAGWGL